MTPQRKIIHIDMDCFYAAVEMRDNPSLRDKPIAVGGRASGRGVIATCNYLARSFGVRSAMPTHKALQLCPDLELVPHRMAVYKQVSQQIHEIFHRYTHLVEPLSLDEAFLDVTGQSHCQGSAKLMAQAIRQEIFDVTGLTASAGIAPNKFLAKVASDENKPNGQLLITPDHAGEFAAALPLKKIPGVGPKTSERLARMGLSTGKDVLALSDVDLEKMLGKFGPVLWQRCQGLDERPVEPSRIRKSVGVETTLAKDLTSLEQCAEQLETLVPELERRLAKSRKGIKGQTVKLKFHDFEQTTVSQQSQKLNPDLFKALMRIAFDRGHGRNVRLVGLQVELDNTQNLKQLTLPLV
ncbi:DNA polymerase IV [Ferrimonas aestuarii]|uniref:DNA polymerase IV n=1 Tax=Ferrimonas aestuarii TaxID=2569539 RepID=A0A4U1BGN0_9GAMM|nr:DNA polymerase IV [Ferrimonas aestuarii]TKB49609.1 DNA polymerase IV [Ferrimonas aestuarii]